MHTTLYYAAYDGNPSFLLYSKKEENCTVDHGST